MKTGIFKKLFWCKHNCKIYAVFILLVFHELLAIRVCVHAYELYVKQLT